MESIPETRMIGAAVKRKEDPRLLMGEGVFTGDVDLKGMVYMAVLRSPHANALIRGIDVSQARSHLGVLLVLTGEAVRVSGLRHSGSGSAIPGDRTCGESRRGRMDFHAEKD